MKKEAVEKVLDNEKNGNPTPTRIVKPIGNGTQILENYKAPNPNNLGIEEVDIRESTLDCVH